MPPKKKPSAPEKTTTPAEEPQRAVRRKPASKPAAAKPAPLTAIPEKPAAKKRAAPKNPAAKPPERKPAAKRSAALSASARPLHVVMVTPEAHPFAKTGGLAEVSGALPAALGRLGHRVAVVLPRYRGVDSSGNATSVDLSFGGRTIPVRFLERELPDGVTAVLVDVPELFDRDGLYGANGRDYPDNAQRFAVLSRAALEYVRLRGERPSVFHAHDWQAGLMPVYQKLQLASDPVVGGVPCVFTIHNLAFQGVFPAHVVPSLGLPWNVLHVEALEFWGQISFLKGGVNFSEKITTVSPTYAKEMLTPDYGFGMQGVIARRAADLSGIVNGIDVERWNPATDAFVPAHFTGENLSGKRDAKRALLELAGLPADDAGMQRPVVGMISRLTDQKGLDLIAAAADHLMSLDASWVLLGSGEPQYEQLFRVMAARHPDRVSATIGFDERLAHFIEAGSDLFLMPSRYEPCGLNQLYSLRYGTLPVVRATGGLEDTVVDASEPGGTGFKFREATPGALVAAVTRALQFYKDPNLWGRLQRSAMGVDASWDVSAREYVKVYRALINAPV